MFFGLWEAARVPKASPLSYREQKGPRLELNLTHRDHNLTMGTTVSSIISTKMVTVSLYNSKICFKH